MTREEIKLKVLCCVDELCEQSATNINVSYPIDYFLEEAATQVLLASPNQLIEPFVDFSKNPITLNLEEGFGAITLPNKFLRLVKFKVKGWKRSVKITYKSCSALHHLQANPATRAGENKPVCVIENGSLLFYPLSLADPVVESALAVSAVDVGPDFPELLISPLVWLTASKALSVLNEYPAAENAIAHYNQSMLLFEKSL